MIISRISTTSAGADVGAQRARLLGAVGAARWRADWPRRQAAERLGRRELAGDSLGECLALPVDDAMQAVRVDVPRAAVVAERGAQVVAVAREAVAGELAQQLLEESYAMLKFLPKAGARSAPGYGTRIPISLR